MAGGATPGPRRSRVGGWAIATVLAVLAVLLYEIRIALLPFIFAVAVAFVLDPPIKRLHRWLGIPRWPVAAALYLLVLEVLERDPVRLKHIRHWRGNWRIPVG